MDKKEFLDILRQSLKGEISSEEIEQNIKYYDHYIGSRTLEDEIDVLEGIGDPRLIAKTIIESKRVAKQKGRFTGSSERSYEYYNEGEADETNQGSGNNRATSFNFHLTWRQKLTLILTIIVILFVLFIVGRVIIGFLFAFGVPILIVLLLLTIFKRRN